VVAGWQNEILVATEGDEIVGGLVLSLRRVPFSPVRLGRVTELLVDPQDPARVLGRLLEALDRRMLSDRLLELEFRLRMPTTSSWSQAVDHQSIRNAFLHAGYEPLRSTTSTYCLAIDRSDEDLLGSFKTEFRNRIRKARSQGVSVETSSDRAHLEAFYWSYLEMSERKGVSRPPRDWFGDSLLRLIRDDDARIYIERYGDQVANMLILDMRGTPCFISGTRSDAHVQQKVFGASQVLHFEVMRALRTMGHRFYDLGGCEGPMPIEGHPNFGVWNFKHGFHGEYVRFLPYFRKVQRPFRSLMESVHQLRGDP
jgi:hypothetical protein